MQCAVISSVTFVIVGSARNATKLAFYRPFLPIYFMRKITMRKRTLVQILFLIALLAGVSVGGRAQDADAPAHERKVTHRVMPAYPELARQARLKGMVRLIAVVAPNGSVKATLPVGGNPVLLKSAAEAVMQYKFASAPTESKVLIEIQFEPK